MTEQTPDILLAKSQYPGKPPVTLKEHLFDTERSAQQIFRLDGRWGRNWCRFFRIQSNEAQQQFLLNLRVAALFHDIGKANEDFYTAVSKPGYTEQTLRHEHISTLMLHLPEVRSWLAANPLLDLEVITAAVLSHHLKASTEGKHRWCQPKTLKKAVKLYMHHAEVTSTFQRIAEIAEIKEGLPALPSTPWSSSSPWAEAYKSADRTARQFGRELREEEGKERRSLLLATKVGLIVSDAAASGLVREGHSIDEWIEDVIHSKAIGPTDIANKIINQRARQVEARTGKPFNLHTFQVQTAQQGSRALLLAACGAGKTMGAWKWAEAQSWEYEIGKVIFLYPTRGTATEGFRDYVGWAPEADAALVTGTARYELEAMADNPTESIKEKDFQSDERLFSLGFWSRRFFSATVDQFLGFMEHSYGSLCLLPVLADSAVIIDEVHSFDRKMFDSLVSFLKNFDIPVLCMTATLPPTRRSELEGAGLKVYPTEADRETLKDLQEKEEHPRYRLEPLANFAEAFDRAVSAYQQGERVLWVVNTVNRCQAIANKLANKLSTDILTYHSRFRLQDRQSIHSKTVSAFAFQTERKPTIAVTTQVCEMSLDLDADVLITEIAPVSSLVQRFGRANRHLFRGLDFRASLHVYQPPRSLPYDKEELKVAAAFLKELGNRDVSQRALAEALENYSLAERKADGSARFLDSGYFATPGAFRDTDDFAVPCILDQDLEPVMALVIAHKPYDGFKINVPKKWANLESKRPDKFPKYLGIASGENYNLERGFLNNEDVELG
jgi:CRISPR-associated endonuclease/helicase Cas3